MRTRTPGRKRGLGLGLAGVLSLAVAAGCDAGTGGGAGGGAVDGAGATAGTWPVELPPGAEHWSFEGVEVDSLPAGLEAPVGEWAVESAGGGQVLTQRAQSAEDAFNLALVRGRSARDLDLWVRVQAVSGEVDQGGGVIWRAAGPRDYYIARWNPLERNFRVYTVKDGVRRQLQSALTDLGPEAWHLLRVTMVGDHIQCRLDGQLLLDVHDTTFAEAGAVGLWTKADAVTRFDDLVLAGRDD